MSFKTFLQLTIFSTLVAWGIWVFFIFTLDPVFASFFELSLFYGTLGLAVIGTLLSVLVAVRVVSHPEIILFRHVATSFRQAVLLAVLLLISLMLLAQSLFTWWMMTLVIMLLSLLEWNAQSLGRRPVVDEHKNDSEDSL